MRSLDEKPYIELWAGEPIEKVSPQRTHALLQGRMYVLLLNLAGSRGDVGTEWRFWVAPGEPMTSLLPDVAYISHERLAALTPEERESPPLAPDIAVEIRSPDDRVKNIEWKMQAYLLAGCKVGFDVIPAGREVRVFTRDGVTTLRHGERFRSRELPWLTFDVAEVFVGIC